MRMRTLGPALLVLMMVAVVFMPATSQAASAQDTLIVGVQADTPNLHPWDSTTNSIWKSFMFRRWVFEGLFGLKPDGVYYPVLANDSRIGATSHQPGWDTDATGLNITVFVRQGITFTDGQALNADDVIFSFQIQSFNSQLSKPLLASIVWATAKWPRWNATTTWGAANPSHVGIEKVDAYTVVFHLQQVYSLFFEGALTNPIMPLHIWKDHLVTVDLTKFKLSGGTEFDFDRSFGAQPSQTQATIGTGPFKLDYWVPTSSAEISTYANYWGKGRSVNWNSKNWPYYPTNIRKIHFNVYGSFDVVVLALKRGDIQIAPWGLSISQWNDITQNPAMGYQLTTSDGFFYIAFNLRRAPMNNLAFRQAVGYAIDKDFIVNRLLGGLGIKGQVPVGPLNPAYGNASATTPSFNLNTAKSILDAAGFAVGADGWRTMPDGTPIRLSILTPAKDYDPVRADSGIMISNNLKSIGLNVDSSPTEFNAIVSAAFVSAEFDMYILGWVNLGLFPELNMRDLWACASDVKLGIGVNAPGYCNTYVDTKLDILDRSLDSMARQQAAKDIEGALAHDLPYDTLYIRRQVEGYRADAWSGWVDANGEIFNAFSISALAPPSQVTPPSGPLKVSLEVPANARANTNLVGQVFAEQNGVPASGASVNISTSYGRYQVVTTDAKGYAAFAIPVPFIAGAFTVVASGSLGISVGGDAATVTAIIPNPFAKLTLWANTPVVTAGATATIHAKVTDRQGNPISGAALSTIPVLTLGKISPNTTATNASGLADFSYVAPSSAEIPNKNQMDSVQVSVAVPNTILPQVSTATYIMAVQNPSTAWDVVRISKIDAGIAGAVPVVDTDLTTLRIPQTLTVTVRVTNQTGAAIANENVTPAVSNSSALSVTPAFALTNSTGYATFQFGALTSRSNPVGVSFEVRRVAFKSQDSLVILVANKTVSAHAMWVDVGPTIGPSRGTFSVTAHVFNQTQTPANATAVWLFSPYSDAGQPPRFAGTCSTPRPSPNPPPPYFTPGEACFTTLLGSTKVIVTDATGTATTTASWATSGSGALQGAFLGDSLITVEAGINGLGPLGAFLFGSPSNTWTLDSAVMARAPPAALAQGSLNKPALSFDDNSGTLTWTFNNAAGPVSGLGVALYRGLGDLRPASGIATKLGAFTTSTAGTVTLTYAEPKSGGSIPAGFTAVITDNRYALGGQFGSVPFETIYPYIVDPHTLVVTGTTQTKLVSAGQTDTFSLTVTDIFGFPVVGATVSGGSAWGVTGSTGQVNLSVPSTAGINNVAFVAYTSDGRSGSARLGTYGGVAVFSLSSLAISNTKPTKGDTVYVNATVSNTGPVAGTYVVNLLVDSATVYQKAVTVPAGGSAAVSFVWVPTDTTAHTVTIGSLTGQTVTASAPAVSAAGVNTALATGLAVGTLIVGLVVGMLMGRRRGGMKPSAEMPKEEEPGEPAEEELPPDL